MSKSVLVFCEYRDGNLRKSSLEALGAGAGLAKELGGEAAAVLLGADGGETAQRLGSAGASRILACTDPFFRNYSGDGYAKALAALVRKEDPAALLFPASALGTDLAPRVAALLDVGMASDCIELKVEGGVIQALRPIYAGKARILVRSKGTPFVATLRPNVFPVPETGGGTPTVETFSSGLEEKDLKDRVKEILASAAGKVPLTEAKIIVSGGRGMKGPDNFKILEELAEAFGPEATVGASRSAVDEGWRPHSDQVGQTGKTVSPQLYIACGISGAIQHLAGMSSSKVIVAVNKDPDAPIFKVADYGIVGDLFQVVPVLTEQVKAAKAQT